MLQSRTANVLSSCQITCLRCGNLSYFGSCNLATFFAESGDIYPNGAPTAGVPRLVSLLCVVRWHAEDRLVAVPKETQQQDQKTEDEIQPREK